MHFVPQLYQGSSHVNNSNADYDYGKLLKDIEEKSARDKTEALQNRTQEYNVIVKEPKLLGIIPNRDRDDENYITLDNKNPNPYNIIQYSQVVKFRTGSEEVNLEDLTGEAFREAFKPLSTHIKAIQPNNESTYVTVTFKSTKPHIPLYPYSVTLTSPGSIGFKRKKGQDINDNDVTIMEIGEEYNPYGITDGSRLVGIMHNGSNGSILQAITYDDDGEDFRSLVEKRNKIDPNDNNTYITLYIVSIDSNAPQKAAAAAAARAAERAARETSQQISGGKSRKTKRHRHRKKSRRSKSRRRNKH
jgi:hypothetical protein